MFQLVRFDENPTSHITDVIVKYEWEGGEERRIQKTFKDVEFARKWMNEQRKIYGHEKLRRFVAHKKILSQTSNSWSTKEEEMEKLASLDICLREVEAVKDYPLWSLAKLIESLYSHLVKILPLQHNLHYKSSKIILNDLWVFSQEVIKPR